MKVALYTRVSTTEQTTENQVIRLMGAYNIIMEKVNQTNVEALYHSEEIISNMPKIQWVTNENIETSIQIPDMLFINNHFNENSLTQLQGFAEKAARKIVIGEIIQFERVGFCRLDSKNSSLNFILAHK